jgi:DNA-binding winged helix-turn-helix (wHTH) protein
MAASFRFGEFELDVGAYVLRRAGQRIRLEKIPMEILVLLVRNAGMLVSRTEIRSALWGSNVYVDHNAAINTAIRKIRRVLADDAETPRFVETVIGKGYRFSAPLATVAADRRPNYLVMRGKRQFVLDRGENLLGRDPAAAVYIDHPSVSRRHACISIESPRAVLEDLRSRNGTFVDGQQIERPTEIQHGAIIGLGPIMLTFVVLPRSASTQPMGEKAGPTRNPTS